MKYADLSHKLAYKNHGFWAILVTFKWKLNVALRYYIIIDGFDRLMFLFDKN
jgi:hypothetical protein